MLRYNLKSLYRDFKRSKVTFIINLIGLSTGMACTLFIYLWVRDELLIDKFHENDTKLFQVMENRRSANGIKTSESNSGLMGKALKEDMPEVEYAVSVFTTGNHTLTTETNQNPIKTSGQYASSDFFNIFSYPLIYGNKEQILNDKNTIALSEGLASRLFHSSQNAVGKTIMLDHDEPYIITGIFKDVPSSSSQRFDFVLPYKKFVDEHREWSQPWGNTWAKTYLVLKASADPTAFNKKIANYIQIKTDNNAEEAHRTAFITPFSQRYLHGKYENGVRTGGQIDYVHLFSVIAVFLILIACINYMNLYTAKAASKSKEIGVKKAVGAHRNALIFQFFTESMLMSMLSLFSAVLLVWLLLPQFNTITGKQLTLPINLYFIWTCLGIATFTGILAGSYPAFYLSGFHPILVLKGKFRAGSGQLWIRKGLVIFQFSISILLIVSVLVVYRQMNFVQTINLGYNKEQLLYFDREGKIEDENALNAFLTEVREIPGVLSASTISHNLQGHLRGTSGIEWLGRDPKDQTEFEHIPADYGAIETLGIDISEGRTFSKDYGSDSSGIIFNEAAIAYMGIKDPIGKTIKLWDEDMRIIGVTKNFHFESLHEKVKPLFFRLAPNETSTLIIRIRGGKEQETISQLRTFYQSINPGFTFDYQFLDKDYQSLYIAEERVATLSGFFAGIAILVSCLGLFALAAFSAEQRTKEIGIRKVLGASVFGVVGLLSKDFVKLVVIAILIAFPMAWWGMNHWLRGFAYHIDLQWWMFALAAFFTLLIAILTVGWQAIRAALANPVKSLREE